MDILTEKVCRLLCEKAFDSIPQTGACPTCKLGPYAQPCTMWVDFESEAVAVIQLIKKEL